MFLRNLLADLVKLRRPVTAASVAATVVLIVSPFGIAVDAAQATSALIAIGVISAYFEHRKSG